MKKHILAVLTAGSLWGTMGLFTRTLGTIGIDSTGAILVRCLLSAVFFGLTILLTDPGQFQIRLKDFWCFFGSGVCSLLFFTFCYFHAINLMSLSAAAILLYTAPSIVMLLSALLFHEKITGTKIAALIMAFAGCCLVSGIMGGDTRITLTSLLFGLGSGLGYALYSIFARYALLRGYSSNTVNFYSCLLAGLGACLISDPGVYVSAFTASWGNALFCLLASAVTCYLPYLLYTYSLTGLENGKASVLASVEPMVATLLGIFVYHEKLTVWSLLGLALVLGAIVLLNRQTNEAAKRST